MNIKLKKYLLLGVAFALGFAAALLVARSFFKEDGSRTEAASAAGEKPRDVDEAGLAAFLLAAEKSDYAAMVKSGPELFRKGVTIPNASGRLESYMANSYPPYTVYAFYSEGSDDRVRRVLLTLDEDDRVESFLAEEMTVLK